MSTKEPSPPAGEAVAYLDIGVGGYLDLGTEKDADELFKLPPGRHMLGIIGTYGVDGYKANPPAAEAPAPVQAAHPAAGDKVRELVAKWRREADRLRSINAEMDPDGKTFRYAECLREENAAQAGALTSCARTLEAALAHPQEAFDPSIHPIPGEGQQPAMPNGVERLSPIYGQVPTVEEARTAIGTALDDAAKALRVLSTMLKKEKLMQGYAVADEILGRLGYATKLNAALAQQPAACRCVDCGGDQPGHDPHCANMREIHGTQPADGDGVLTPTGTFCSVCEAPQEGEALARKFHDTYERLAPSFGYETRRETRQFDPETPNGRLMIAVCAVLTAALAAQPGGASHE